MTNSQAAISAIFVQTLQTSTVLNIEEESLINGLLSSTRALDLYNCLKEDIWQIICTKIDNGQTQEKSKAMTLLDQVLTRITVELKPGETLEWFN